MSDIAPENLTADSTTSDGTSTSNEPDPGAAATDTTAEPVDPLDARIHALEGRVTALETPAAPVTVNRATGATAFDTAARTAELLAQGLSEEDANEQASYEERNWNDRNAPAA